MGLRTPAHRFIHGEKTAVTENRLAGFYQACEELGLKVPEEYVRCGVYHDVDAAQRRPGRCWHCRSGPPASSSRMTFPHWAATTP